MFTKDHPWNFYFIYLFFPFWNLELVVTIRVVQTSTGADKTDWCRPSRIATAIDQWSRCRRTEREESSDSGVVQ